MLLDTASLYYRAYYGLPTTLKAPDGTMSNAVRGMIDFASRLKTEHSPDVMVACWDEDWRPQWRVDLIPSYKAHRVEEELDDDPDLEETPDDLAIQIPAIAEGLELLGIPVLGAPGAEAEDVAASLAAQHNGPVDIISGDRDVFQLVDDSQPIRVLYTARGVSKLDVLDDAAVFAKYQVHANQYVDFAVLRGDPSDGLPGVPGIGEKTAARLLGTYGSLAAIEAAAAEDASDLSPKIRSTLVEHRSYIAAAQQVVRIRTDIPVRIPEQVSFDSSGFDEFEQEWGLGSVAKRATAAFA